jgi:serine/threonine protein kinase/tetratricopeptide (TPR) repeat protein
MRPGDIIGDRFEIDKHVASGGMGQVFRARDVHSGELVALKMLLGDPASHIARFDHERRALTRLSHPGIVRYVAHGVSASGEPYLAMEWLEGEDLSSRLARGRLTIKDSVDLATRVAEALSAAHARDIIHRDLKPSNIFLVDRHIEHAKVLDFGIARMENATRVTLAGTIIGTLGYMAPEQAGNELAVDSRADVFSLGCVLFECLTGTPAFVADHPMALLTKLVFAEPPRLSDMLPSAPEALDALLWRMLAKDPAQRPQHGGALADALVALGPHIAAGPSAPPALAITLHERRMISVVLVGGEHMPTSSTEATHPGEPTQSDLPTLPGAHANQALPTLHVERPTSDMSMRQEVERAHTEQTLRHGAASWGGRLEQLRDGSMVVAIGGAGLITDQAAQAARCALWLRTRVSGRRMALATGRGDKTGRTPAAETIDRAAELLVAGAEDATNSLRDGIVIDEVTARLLDAQFDVRKTDQGYALHGEQELVESARMLLGRTTPCVGRDLELRTLEQLFEECIEEPAARAAIVTAPPGAGKSRVAQEFLRSVRGRREPVAVRVGRGEPHRAGSAFGLLSQILRSACGILDSDPLEVQRDKLVARVATRIEDSERQRVAEFLGEIAGTPFPDDDQLPLRVARQDAQLMNEQMRAAFLDFLRAETTANPVLLVLEDMQWGDRPTVQFLDVALRDLRERPFFVVALARPEVHELFPDLWEERSIQKIALKQLGKKASESLVRIVLGEGVDRELVDRLVRLSEGNAFYLEELIRVAAEGQRSDLPETVVTMVQARLGALDDDARRILRAAAVFGEVFWPGAVAQLLGSVRRGIGMGQRLEELTNREVLLKRKQSRFSGEEEYAFRHALLREGAYTMLTDEDRMLGHRLAGEWLEQHGEQDPLALAEHFERGREGARASLHYLHAAELANKGGDAAAAIARAKRALTYNLPDELRIRCLGMLCELHYYSMDLQSNALPHAEEVLRVAPRGSGPWSQGMLLKIVSSIQAGNLDEFLALLELVGDTSPAPDAATPWAICVATGIFLLDLLGRTHAANHLFEKLTAGIRTVGDHEPMATVLFHSILAIRMSYAEEDPMKGLAHGETLLRLSEATGQRRFGELAKNFIGMNRWCLGVLAGTDRMIMDVTLSDNDTGLASSYRPFVLAWLLADRGSFDEARIWAGRLIEAGQTRRVPLDVGRGHWAVAEVLRRKGELAGADAEIEAALAILRMASPLDTPGALATLAALRGAQGRTAEALAAAEEALAKYEAMGACGFFRGAFLRLVHAECLEATGDHEAAKAAIARARARLFVIAAKIGEPEHRKSFLEDVPENRQTLALARQWVGPDEELPAGEPPAGAASPPASDRAPLS